MAGNESTQYTPVELTLAGGLVIIAIVSIVVTMIPGMLAYVG